MVVTRANAFAGWGINLLEWTVNPYNTSEISKLQDFYWLSYEELFDTEAMKNKDVPEDKIEYIVENRETQFAKKSTKGYELRKWVMQTERYKKLQEFYGFTLDDTQDIDVLLKMWIEAEDVEFITGKEVKKTTKKEDTTDVNVDELRELHKEKFGKYPNPGIKLETLINKLK